MLDVCMSVTHVNVLLFSKTVLRVPLFLAHFSQQITTEKALEQFEGETNRRKPYKNILSYW